MENETSKYSILRTALTLQALYLEGVTTHFASVSIRFL